MIVSRFRGLVFGITLVTLPLATPVTPLSAKAATQTTPAPLGLVHARPPDLPIRTAGGGEVLLDVEVAPDGAVNDVRVLRVTPPFTDLVVEAVRSWRFETVQEVDEPYPERVLVAALFRAPSFYSATTAGAAPVDVGSSSAVPFPTEMVAPPYPPNTTGDAVVIAELSVGARGEILASKISSGGPPFDAAALEGLRGWRFRTPPSGRGARWRPSAIVIFGFREPVLGP